MLAAAQSAAFDPSSSDRLIASRPSARRTQARVFIRLDALGPPVLRGLGLAPSGHHVVPFGR